jgi:hypothetical protein
MPLTYMMLNVNAPNPVRLSDDSGFKKNSIFINCGLCRGNFEIREVQALEQITDQQSVMLRKYIFLRGLVPL